jgi:hypothetical protein
MLATPFYGQYEFMTQENQNAERFHAARTNRSGKIRKIRAVGKMA